MTRETFRHLWSVTVFYAWPTWFDVTVWRDTADGAETAIQRLYPHARMVVADRDSGPMEAP